MTGFLTGKVVLITRPREEAGELATLLEERGAHPLVAPAIERFSVPDEPLGEALRSLVAGRFAWAVFTSEAGVEAVLTRLGPRVAGNLRARVAAIGQGTAGALRRFGVEPDLVPSTFTTADLGRALPRGSGNVLLARADIAPDGLDEAVAAKGWTPIRVDAYATRYPDERRSRWSPHLRPEPEPRASPVPARAPSHPGERAWHWAARGPGGPARLRPAPGHPLRRPRASTTWFRRFPSGPSPRALDGSAEAGPAA